MTLTEALARSDRGPYLAGLQAAGWTHAAPKSMNDFCGRGWTWPAPAYGWPVLGVVHRVDVVLRHEGITKTPWLLRLSLPKPAAATMASWRPTSATSPPCETSVFRVTVVRATCRACGHEPPAVSLS